MWLCKRDLSKECEGKYKDCTDCVLDKIRAEIEYIGGDDKKAFCKNLNESYKQGLKDALKVIDKYKAERSGMPVR